MERVDKGFGSTGISGMETELVEIYAIDVMPKAMEEKLKELMLKEYHNYLNLADPEGPFRELPPLHPGYDFEIQLDISKPLPHPARPYHMNASEQEDWRTWCDLMLKAGHISRAPVNTPIVAPFFFVWKKDGSRHPVIDYQKLNDITVKDSFPLPRIDEMLERMQGAKVFSKFDLKMGYNLLRIKLEDIWKTAFMTHDRPFMMNVMTFGFANAPSYFQRWMSDILALVQHQCVENYLDDTATHHLDLQEHIKVN